MPRLSFGVAHTRAPTTRSASTGATMRSVWSPILATHSRLTPVKVTEAWRETVRAQIPELPLARHRRYVGQYALSAKEAAALYSAFS